MNVSDARAAIKAFIAAGYTAHPLRFVNEPNQETPADGTTFVDIDIVGPVGGRDAARAIGGPGNRLMILEGTIMAHVFVPIGTEDISAAVQADLLADLLLYKNIPVANNCAVYTTAPIYSGADGSARQGNYFRATVAIPFDFYQRF